MQTQTLTKTCDGTHYNGPVTMHLTRHQNGSFSYTLVNKENAKVCHEILTERKTPVFSESTQTFSVLGIPTFKCESDSTARFNDMKQFFDQYFNTRHAWITFNGNNYEGETKDNVPNGRGVMYYKNTSNIMAKSTFAEGCPDGQTVFYSMDQNIELVCDDICNMKSVQRGTIIFRNKGIEKEVIFDEFSKCNVELKNGVNKFVHSVAQYVLMEDRSIPNVDLFLFANKTQQEQYTGLFELLTKVQIEQKHNSHQLMVTQKYFQYSMTGMLLGFIYFMCNMVNRMF